MVYAIEGHRAKIESVRAAMREILERGSDISKMDALFDEAIKVLRARNDYAHGFYVRKGKRAKLCRWIVDEDLSTQRALVPVTVRELQIALSRTIKLTADAFAFGKAIYPTETLATPAKASA